MNPVIFHLDGPKVVLRSLERSDLAHIIKWTNDPEMMRITGETERMTPKKAREYLKTVKADKNRAWFIILDKATKKPIGECGLLRIFKPWRTADLTMIIGEREYWGMGHSDEAMGLLLDHAFGKLGLHRVAVGVVDFNERAIKFYERFGFREEGRQRDGYLLDDRYHDFVMMSLLDEEYWKDKRAHNKR